MATIIPSFLFAGIMLATILVSGLPRLSIRLLEWSKLFKKGKLFSEKRNYVDGEGKYVYRKVYLYYGENGGEKIANLPVFIRILFLSLLLAAIAFAIYIGIIA